MTSLGLLNDPERFARVLADAVVRAQRPRALTPATIPHDIQLGDAAFDQCNHDWFTPGQLTCNGARQADGSRFFEEPNCVARYCDATYPYTQGVAPDRNAPDGSAAKTNWHNVVCRQCDRWHFPPWTTQGGYERGLPNGAAAYSIPILGGVDAAKDCITSIDPHDPGTILQALECLLGVVGPELMLVINILIGDEIGAIVIGLQIASQAVVETITLPGFVQEHHLSQADVEVIVTVATVLDGAGDLIRLLYAAHKTGANPLVDPSFYVDCGALLAQAPDTTVVHRLGTVIAYNADLLVAGMKRDSKALEAAIDRLYIAPIRCGIGGGSATLAPQIADLTDLGHLMLAIGTLFEGAGSWSTSNLGNVPIVGGVVSGFGDLIASFGSWFADSGHQLLAVATELQQLPSIQQLTAALSDCENQLAACEGAERRPQGFTTAGKVAVAAAVVVGLGATATAIGYAARRARRPNDSR